MIKVQSDFILETKENQNRNVFYNLNSYSTFKFCLFKIIYIVKRSTKWVAKINAGRVEVGPNLQAEIGKDSGTKTRTDTKIENGRREKKSVAASTTVKIRIGVATKKTAAKEIGPVRGNAVLVQKSVTIGKKKNPRSRANIGATLTKTATPT
jgi:hypothetical protein